MVKAAPFFCGLDFGTSNSALSAGTDINSLSLIPLERDHVTIPSAMFFNTEENNISFGRAGMDEYRTGYEGRLLKALKSILGSELIDESTQIGREKKSFRDIIGIFIAHVKKQAEAQLGTSLENIVLGRPVHFVDDHPAADQRAENELRGIAAKTGFKNIHFEYEPLAAARDYESRIEKEEIVLVFDIGGGTSDFSVVRLSPHRKNKFDRADDILSNHGIHIGGTNFDQKLSLETVMKDLGYRSKLKTGLDMPAKPYFDFSTWHLINMLYTQKNISSIRSLLPLVENRPMIELFLHLLSQQRGHQLAEKVEEAKILLSDQKLVSLDLKSMADHWRHEITIKELEKSVLSDLERIMLEAKETVARSNNKISNIDTIF